MVKNNRPTRQRPTSRHEVTILSNADNDDIHEDKKKRQVDNEHLSDDVTILSDASLRLGGLHPLEMTTGMASHCIQLNTHCNFDTVIYMLYIL